MRDNGGWGQRGLILTCPRCETHRQCLETVIYGSIRYYCHTCEHEWRPTEPRPSMYRMALSDVQKQPAPEP